MSEEAKKEVEFEEKQVPFKSGGAMLVLVLLGFAVFTVAFVFGVNNLVAENYVLGGILLAVGIAGWIGAVIALPGFHIVNPNQAMVFTLFGKYYGTIKKEGFYYINPFAGALHPNASVSETSSINAAAGGTNASATVQVVQTGKKISLKTMTLNNEKQKVNDVLGNPIIIGAIVIWKVVDPTKAVLNVENYQEYLSRQCDSTIRNIARLYPYDTVETVSDEKTLRGSSQEIADMMKKELMERVQSAGIEIDEVKITHLSYAEEIAAAMLQRQQAAAIIAARQKIVEGAVSMVKMAIDQLSEDEIVVLDEERKAAMVSNLLVVLCGNKDAQPVVNSSSIY